MVGAGMLLVFPSSRCGRQRRPKRGWMDAGRQGVTVPAGGAACLGWVLGAGRPSRVRGAGVSVVGVDDRDQGGGFVEAALRAGDAGFGVAPAGAQVVEDLAEP